MNFKNRYRRSSLRLKNYDFGKEGLYLITLPANKCVQYFWQFIKDKIVKNECVEMMFVSITKR